VQIWHIEATSPAVEIQLKLAAAWVTIYRAGYMIFRQSASWRLNGKMLKPTSTYYVALDPTFSVLCSTYEDEKVVSRKLTLSVKSLVLAHRIHRHGSGVGRVGHFRTLLVVKIRNECRLALYVSHSCYLLCPDGPSPDARRTTPITSSAPSLPASGPHNFLRCLQPLSIELGVFQDAKNQYSHPTAPLRSFI
jgi:hypothetical protein